MIMDVIGIFCTRWESRCCTNSTHSFETGCVPDLRNVAVRTDMHAPLNLARNYGNYQWLALSNGKNSSLRFNHIVNLKTTAFHNVIDDRWCN